MSNLDVALRLRLINQLGGPAKDAKKELEGVGAAAKKLDGAKADKLAKDLAKTKTEAKGTDAALQKVAAGAKKIEGAKADRIARDLAKAKTEAKAGEKALAQFQRTLKQLDGSHAERLVAGLRNATAASERLARSLKRVREEARGVDAGGGGRLPPAHRVGAKPPSAGDGSGGLPPAIVAGSKRLMGTVGAGYLGYRTAASGVRTVVDQDKAWAEVRKKVNATPEELQAINVQLRATARKYGLQISEVFQQAAEAGASGIDKSDLLKFVELTTRASVGWDTTARETAQRIAEIKAGTGMALPQIDDLANKINALGDNSAAKERDIVEMFHRSAAAAKKAGVSFDDTLAILTAVRSTGMQEEVASRWFNAFSWELAGAHTKDKKKKEAWGTLGFKPMEIAKGMKDDAAGTIIKVLDAFNKFDQLKQIEIGSALFGAGWQDEFARAAQAVDEIKKQLTFIHDSKNWQGSLQTSLDIQLSTTASHWERIKAAASETAEQINRATGATTAFNSATDSALQKFEKLLSRWQQSPEASDQARERFSRTPIGRLFGIKGPDGKLPGDAPRPEADKPRPASELPPKSSFPGRFQSSAYAAAKRELELNARADAPLRGPMSPIQMPPNFSPMRNYSPVPPSAEAQAQATMQGITRAITTEGAKAAAEAEAIAERIKAKFNFTATPTISPRFGGAPAQPAPAAPAPTGKGASLNRGVNVTVNVTGAGRDGRQIGQDIARQLAQLGNNSGALFDTV